jgi:hypothetical protein
LPPQHLQVDSKEQLVQYVTDSSILDRVRSATSSVSHVASLQVASGLMFFAVSLDICYSETSDKVRRRHKQNHNNENIGDNYNKNNNNNNYNINDQHVDNNKAVLLVLFPPKVTLL